MKKHPLYRAYYFQKMSCRKRKDRTGLQIEMKLSFDEWLAIWQSSGHLHERGKGVGKYVMSRINDLGHYEANNVCIVTHIDNILEGNGRRIIEPAKALLYNGKSYVYDLSLRPTTHLRRHSLSDSQLLDIIPRHEDGESWGSISKDYNVSSWTIRQTIYQIKYSYPLP